MAPAASKLNADEREHVCITGMSGFFPDTDNVRDLHENLMNKVDMLSPNERRWKTLHPEMPMRSGKVNVINKFDATFFKVNPKQADCIDPLSRMLVEKCFEAIYDAGVNPSTLRGSNTGVFVAVCCSEAEATMLCSDDHSAGGYPLLGTARALLANRVSYLLDLRGPSFVLDSACSASMHALHLARRAIDSGECDAALVGSANLTLMAKSTLSFARLGVLSPDGYCKPFEKEGGGYSRSEAIVALLLQKRKDSNRIYARVVHSTINNDGYKSEGIAYPSTAAHVSLYKQLYGECGVNPLDVEYLEAHGTGTIVGDPQEMSGLDEFFTPGRAVPLKIGSVKSNLGHSEPASTLCSLVKLCIGYKSGILPPNMHFKSPREELTPIVEGRLQVVSEPTPWGRGFAALNSFGFGGSNGHALLAPHSKATICAGVPNDTLPRLLCVSGRMASAVDRILDDAESRPVDAEYVRLLHGIHEENIEGHPYRGYTILRPNNAEIRASRSVKRYPDMKRPVCFVFSGMGSQWPGCAIHLMELPVFAEAIEKCHKVLEDKGMDLKGIVTNTDPSVYENVHNTFVAITAVQIGLCEVLKALEIVPDMFLGHSMGEIACSYYDGSMTIDEAILTSYYRGLVSIEIPTVKGSMAAVGMGYSAIKNLCPPDIEVACHNGPDSCTISGPAEAMTKFVGKLMNAGVFAKQVACANIAYHSRHIKELGKELEACLTKVIHEPKKRGSKWLCTSLPVNEWDTPKGRYSSAEYHTNNLLNPVYFEETSKLIPGDSINIEIAPHGLLIPILKRSLKKTCSNVSLTKRHSTNSLEFLLGAIGELYELGLNPKLHKLYPPIALPVSHSVPYLSHLIEWDHSTDWKVAVNTVEIIKTSERLVRMSLSDERYEYLAGHNIDGRNLFAATGYLHLVWETLCMMQGVSIEDTSVVFEDVRFDRATNIPADEPFELTIVIPKKTGYFEVVDGNTAVVRGNISVLSNAPEWRPLAEPHYDNKNYWELSSKDIYKEFRLRGYNYSGMFRGIKSSNLEGSNGYLAWSNNWVTFMDTLLQYKLLSIDTRGLFVPTRLTKLTIDVKRHYAALAEIKGTEKGLPVTHYKDIDVLRSGGVEVRGVFAMQINKKRPSAEPVLENYQFVPNQSDQGFTVDDAIRVNVQILVENLNALNIKCAELFDPPKNKTMTPLMPAIRDALGDLPLIQADLTVFSESEVQVGPNIAVRSDEQDLDDTEYSMIVGSDLLQRTERLLKLADALRDKGIVISREKTTVQLAEYYDKLDIITVFRVGNEKLVMLMKTQLPSKKTFLSVAHKEEEESFKFVEEIKSVLNDITQKDEGGCLVLVSEKDELNGVLGLANCLRKEIGANVVKCVSILDRQAPPFDPDLAFYQSQLDKDLGINVYKNGTWGTYRHLLLEPSIEKEVEHAYCDVVQRGDLSSISWLQGDLNAADKEIVHTYYSSLNYRDIVTASGKVFTGIANENRLVGTCCQGMEFSGKTTNGTRVMCVTLRKGIANLNKPPLRLIWPVPDYWTLEDAATVPVAYSTVIASLFVQSNMRPGSSILIHAGLGGVGQACINVCLHYGCEIFTTVGSEEKRKLLKSLFPQIEDDHIGSTRDTSFEDMIFTRTKGKGVDFVLNSLSEEKLHASLRCLAKRGIFIEIGKYDIVNNTLIGMYQLLRSITIIGLNVFEDMSEEALNKLDSYMIENIRNGAIKPLMRHTFQKDEISKAFRFMAASKHRGKVVIKIREDEIQNSVPEPITMKAIPTFKGNHDMSYIVVGGLGGFGLEMTDWLILRGARRIVINSRRGLKNGYQSYRIELWKSYGAQILINMDDAGTKDGCTRLVKMANALGTVAGIFNLAVVLNDAVIENQTPEMFAETFKPKSDVTLHLDRTSRQLCPDLKHFVVFSSVTCGRGNAGQSNYGMANSIAERICERRKRDGLCALALQWGAVGDVGLVADMQEEHRDLEISGTLQQRITNCLQVLDRFMTTANALRHPIVSSMVVAEKRLGDSTTNESVLARLTRILNVDMDKVSPLTCISDLGMDSIMAVEIKQMLERDFEIFLTQVEIKNLTVEDIQKMSAKEKIAPSDRHHSRAEKKLDFIVKGSIKDESIWSDDIVSMKTLVRGDSEANAKSIFMLPGMEGASDGFESLCKRLKCKAYVLQYGYSHPRESVQQIAKRCTALIMSRMHKGRFMLLGYSFGAMVAIEVAKILESKGHKGRLILVDGSPEYIRTLLRSSLGNSTEAEFECAFMEHFLGLVAPGAGEHPLVREVLGDACPTWDDKIAAMRRCDEFPGAHRRDYVIGLAEALHGRLAAIEKYAEDESAIKSPAVLIACGETDCNAYGLQCIAELRVVRADRGTTHATVLEGKQCANLVNEMLLLD